MSCCFLIRTVLDTPSTGQDRTSVTRVIQEGAVTENPRDRLTCPVKSVCAGDGRHTADDNSCDLANVGRYTLDDGSPVFDVAIIFAANINYDGTNAYLHLNEQVQATLDDAATQVTTARTSRRSRVSSAGRTPHTPADLFHASETLTAGSLFSATAGERGLGRLRGRSARARCGAPVAHSSAESVRPGSSQSVTSRID